MEASDLIGKQWTCPQCKTNEVINASGIDHKCSNYHAILPLESLGFKRYEYDNGTVLYMMPLLDGDNY